MAEGAAPGYSREARRCRPCAGAGSGRPVTGRPPRRVASLPPEQARLLRRALTHSADVTVFVDGTANRLPGEAQAAVVDLLARLSDGDAVQVTTVAELLTTSQAAELAGISNSYLRKLTDAGTLAVEYRGSHRRIRRSDVEEWLRAQLRRSGTTQPGSDAERGRPSD